MTIIRLRIIFRSIGTIRESGTPSLLSLTVTKAAMRSSIRLSAIRYSKKCLRLNLHTHRHYGHGKGGVGRKKLTNQLDGKPDDYQELFVVEIDQKNRSFRAVGVDAKGRYILEQYAEYSLGSATGSTSRYSVLTDLEYGRYARLALLNGQLKEEDYHRLTAEPIKAPKRGKDSFYQLLAGYPDLVVNYCIVENERYVGYESHRKALKTACGEICRDWNSKPDQAIGKSIAADEMFSSKYQPEKLNYRKAFLYPPHENSYTGKDFVRVNAVLFPNGTDELEVYEWNTDWSEYFDEGHEWWGTICLTVYDKTLDRFVVIMSSATD